LWNAVEHAEKRHDARLAREVEVALPKELSLPEQIRMTEEYVITNFVDRGMIADVAIHDKGDGNPHFHCLLTTRDVSPDGFGKKNREWDKRAYVDEWREKWASIQNREFKQKGLEITVSHDSYAVQDFGRAIERTPTIHRGPRIDKYKRSGKETDRMDEYNEIITSRRKEQERQQERKRRRGHERGR
jgi:ATP-dependent exoDNAse (exonuclease V) alpha subunit